MEIEIWQSEGSVTFSVKENVESVNELKTLLKNRGVMRVFFSWNEMGYWCPYLKSERLVDEIDKEFIKEAGQLPNYGIWISRAK